ncbi:hypothetical protein AX17_001763 [Amanita inopinata Kibby_2008]|nr:hypothetical protein AX17_001763 [Amanita inopinata Kibby_2008]
MEESDLESAMVDILESPPTQTLAWLEAKTGTPLNAIKQTVDKFFETRRVLAAAVEEAVSKVILEFEDRTSTGSCPPCQNTVPSASRTRWVIIDSKDAL